MNLIVLITSIFEKHYFQNMGPFLPSFASRHKFSHRVIWLNSIWSASLCSTSEVMLFSYTYLPPPSIPLLRSLLFSRTFPYLVTIIALCGHSLRLIPILSPFKYSHGGLFTFALVGNFKEVRFLNPFLIEFRIGTSDVK